MNALELLGIGIYGGALCFAVLILRRAAPRSLDELLQLGRSDHHSVAEVFKLLPRGGSWKAYAKRDGE